MSQSNNRTVSSNNAAELERSRYRYRREVLETEWSRRGFTRPPATRWVQMTDGSLIQLPARLTTPGNSGARGRASGPPQVVRINLGGSSGNYNTSGGRWSGRWVDTGVGGVQNFRPGIETAVPVTPELQTAMNLARMLRPTMVRANMFVSLVDLAVQIGQAIHQGWAPWNWPALARSVVDNPGGFAIVNVCEQGDVLQRACVAAANAPIPCTPTSNQGTFCRTDALTYWFFGKQFITAPYNPTTHVRPRFALARPTRLVQQPNGTWVTRGDFTYPAPSITPRWRPVTPRLRIPFALAPYQPSTAGTAVPGRQASYGTLPRTDTRGVRRWPNPDVTKPSEPPGPKVKERKAKLPKWFAMLAEAAWEATEVVDLIDALFEALPEDVQASVPRTAVTSPSAWKPGIRYAGPLDRARHLYNNLHRLDIEEAVINVVINQIEDALWGRFFGGADRGFRRAGVNGYGALF